MLARTLRLRARRPLCVSTVLCSASVSCCSAMAAVAPHGVTTDPQLNDPGEGVRLKVCGATQPAEIEALASEPVDFVGLWFGVPGGPADLELAEWRGGAGPPPRGGGPPPPG